MNPLPALALLIAGLLPAACAVADQDDPRLDPLFADLRTAPSPAAARPIESRIWALWQHSDQPGVSTLMMRGIVAMNQEDLDAALDAFDEVVAQAPAFAEGWNKRATVHYLRGDYGHSMRDIQRTLALEPRHFGALSGMGLIFLAIDDLRGALRAFRAVLEIHPQSPSARHHVERLRERLAEELI
ncbi:MAG: tetratricopeptide repeat protein [Candidatus Competibacterales bacterium]|nr:tetratricopeptide repeat protein [Candidatus Competibacterales bacterium]